jgi:subfamily B ATP-binding cassette protein MsbA
MVRPYSGRLLASALCTLLVGALSVLLISLSVSLTAALQGQAPAPAAAGPAASSSLTGAPPPVPLAALRGDLLARLRQWVPRIPPIQSGGAAFVGVGFWVLGLAALKSLFEFLSDYNLGLVGLRVTFDLRAKVHETVLRQPVPFFWQHPTGSLMSRITGDVMRLQRVVSGDVSEMLRLTPILAFQVAWVFYLYPDLSFLIVIVLPLIVWPIVRFGRKMKRASRKTQERSAELSAMLQETLSGVRVVKAFGAERFEGARFRRALERLLEPDRRALKLGALTPAVIALSGALALSASLMVLGWKTGFGGVDPRTLPGFALGLGYLFAAAKSLARVNNSVQQGMAAARRVFQLLDLPPEPLEDPALPPLPPVREGVEFAAVHFAYGRRDALRGIDLSVRAGEMVALVGPSGAGKTTLVNLLPRFFDPTAGEVRIDGRDTRRVRLSSLRAQIGLVGQEVVLFDDTVRRNIAYALGEVPQEAVERAARAACAEEFILALPAGYDTRIGEGGQLLSAGQRQRLSIARAILKDAPILILDEVTSALDAQSEALLSAALENLMRGRTVFVIAHRMSTVRRADRIVVLEAGRIVESGTHAELMARGRLYHRLHQLQFRDDAASAAGQVRPAVG